MDDLEEMTEMDEAEQVDAMDTQASPAGEEGAAEVVEADANVDLNADTQASASASPAAPATSAIVDTPPDLPAAFPKKRRGRPPGRPNKKVREEDYEGVPEVQAWNAAKRHSVMSVVPIYIRDAISEQTLVHDTQRAIFNLPSREIIYFVQGWITGRHIASKRPSYINGLLIHSRGEDSPVQCAQCAERRSKNALGPFITCRILAGNYHNSCSNCKWFDNTSACSLYTGPKPNRKRKAKDADLGQHPPGLQVFAPLPMGHQIAPLPAGNEVAHVPVGEEHLDDALMGDQHVQIGSARESPSVQFADMKSE